MKYSNVKLAHVDKNGLFVQTTVGKRVLKHVYRAIRSGATVTMDQYTSGSHVAITRFSEWRRLMNPRTVITSDVSEVERTITAEYVEKRYPLPPRAVDFAIYANFEIHEKK
jgi:hypothetical protein